MPALDTLTGSVTNQTSLTALTMVTGDSLTIRSCPPEQRPLLMNAWTQGATAQKLRIRSPRLHDFQQGILLGNVVTVTAPLLPEWMNQPLWPLDLLTVEELGGGAEVDGAQLMLYYPNLPGSSAQLHTIAEVLPRIVNYLTLETTATGNATAFNYSPTTAFNAGTNDLIKAGVFYAILGYVTPVNLLGVHYRGPFSANLRCSGPGGTNRQETRDWFMRLSSRTGLPTIPVFNGADKGSTFIETTESVTSTSRVVQTILAELSGTWTPPQ